MFKKLNIRYICTKIHFNDKKNKRKFNTDIQNLTLEMSYRIQHQKKDR